MATDYNATFEQGEITLRIALRGIVVIGSFEHFADCYDALSVI